MTIIIKFQKKTKLRTMIPLFIVGNISAYLTAKYELEGLLVGVSICGLYGYICKLISGKKEEKDKE